MKNTYFENNPLTEEELKKLWDSAIFVFDTNVLLNLYRYSDDTSENFLSTIIKLNDRVWIPFQVGLEFHKNRLKVLSDQKKHYQDFEKKINEIIGEIENKHRSPFLSQPLFEKLVSIKNDIKTEVDNKIQKFDKQLNDDSILNKINSVFEGKVGKSFEVDEIKQLFTDGEKRYDQSIPPGYNDIKKPENERYGDLIIWKQILSKANTDQIDIILILDDRKEDWWLEHQGKTISPRPELLKEFRVETNKTCHFYKPFQFLEYSNQYLGNTIRSEVIEEVKNYQPKLIKDEPILLHWTLKGKIQDLNLLINEMKDTGYHVYKELSSTDTSHEVYILLPNIPDLERRLNAKYLSNLANYNLSLVNK
jgi:hypothetical protein